MENKKSIGLPGGPNEFLKDITQYISIEGYKRYSKDINNPVNIIESGSITMEDVDFPVMGTDNLGNSQMMMPGNNYQFPGDQVFEVPMAQYGLSTMQDKVLTKEEEEDIKNYRGYINSDLFKNRVSLVGNDPKEVQTKYLNNLYKIKYSEDTDYLESMNSHGTITYDRSDTKKDSDGFKYISNINAILHPDRGRGTALHETDHGTTIGNKDLNTDQIIDIVRGQGLTKERLENFKLLGNSYNLDPLSARGHFGNPSEIHARISSTRKFLLDQGMHQEFGEDITDEQIEKLWKQKENSNFWINQRNNNVQDLMRTSANKGNFKRLMNEVAYNDLPSVTNNIRMAQDGLERNPEYIDSTFNANKDKRWVQRLYETNPDFYLEGQTKPSTHFMESGDGYVYPRVMEDKNGQLKKVSREEGRAQGIKFPTDEEAQWFAKNYKQGTNVLKKKKRGGGGLLDKTMKCNSCGWSWKAADGGADVSTCHKCGGSALPKAQDGRETSEDSPISAFLNKTQDNVNDWLGDTMNPKDINKLFDLDLMGQMKILEDEYAKIWDSVNDELGQPENESAINNDPRVNDAWLRMNSFRDANPEVLQYKQAEDPLRHAIASANTSRAIQQKVRDTPYIGSLLDYIGADKAAGFVGSNLAGIGHEAMTILNDDRDLKDKGKESWEDIYNNFQGSLIGAQDISQEEIANKAFELYNAKKLKEGIVYQQGGQPTAQEGNGEYVLNNLQDFTITQQELDYLNDKDNNYCPGGNCLENTKNAFNKTAGTIPGVKDYYETWEKDLQATSQKNKPTQEQIEEMPWYKGDGNVASVDSWDVQGKIVDSGGTTVYNKNNSDSTYTPGKAAIGSIYSFGPSSRKDSGNKKRNQGYSKEFNLQPSHHSVSVVGFDDESNENILYDAYFREYLNESDLIKKWEDHNLNYELEAIGTPKNYTGLTRENLKGNKYLKQDKTVRPYELDLKKLQPLTEDNEVQYTERDSDGNVSSRQPRFNSSAMKPFVNSLKKNKGVVMDVLNIGNSQYDELANLAVALAMGESEGGAGLSLDFLGETQGLTQLNYENISKDEVLNKSLKKINSKLDKKERITDIGSLRNPSKSAIASLLYLSKVKSRSKQAHEQGLNPSERTFYDNSNSLKETFRYSSAKINKDSFYVDAIGERIPFKDIPGWDNKDTKEVTNYLNTVSKSNDYIAKLDDKGKISVTMKTKGNNPNLSLGKRIGYFWQSPNSLKTGDAQGDNVHASRINHYFNSINNLQSGGLIKAQLGNGEYKVSSGDTFYGIANKNNVTWDELKKANPNIGYNDLKLNQSIVIPKKIDKPANVIKRETVKESVQDFQITPQLLYKQAYIESNLNPKAKNSLGYMGLGQIGKSLINDYKKANKVDTVDPFDPKQNYDVQAWSMNELFNSSFIDKPGSTMENRLLKSLASYNWGRGNVLNLLKAQKAKGSDIYNSTEWMQHLPKETKEYIQMIVYDGKPEKRPLVQENFLKTTTDEKYKDLRALYNYKQGGEPNLFDMYSGYINGDYDGTEFESKAALTYDKLNRVYYREAKDAGMNIPNYIMTYVIGNS